MTDGRRLLVLDDDPTGSQCVADVAVALDQDPALAADVLARPGSCCFVLTNSRALPEAEAVATSRRIVGGVLDTLQSRGAADGLHVVSRSDSTLRGHVIAEPAAIADELEEHGITTDAILLCPAMLEAGRFTRENVHYATVDGAAVEVAATDFAADATFGYTRSDLPAFLEERSGGAVRAGDVLCLGLDDIRSGGVQTVVDILAGARDRRWVVVNATEYRDMEVVAEAVTRLEAAGRTLITRCAPSFVRALAGQRGATVIDPEQLRIAPDRRPGGLVVVGSHVGLTTQQLAVVQERGGLTEIELDVPTLLDPERAEEHLAQSAAAAARALESGDCVVSTSRTLVRAEDREESLAIARRVSDAVVRLVQQVRTARPAWVVAKGGITSHEVAEHGLGIRRARVLGQFFPGQISLFLPEEAPADVLGAPYVVFPGNVGSRTALAEVIDILRAAVHENRPDLPTAEPAAAAESAPTAEGEIR